MTKAARVVWSAKLADLDWFHAEVQCLYGFAVRGIDYAAPVETDIPWPDIATP